MFNFKTLVHTAVVSALSLSLGGTPIIAGVTNTPGSGTNNNNNNPNNNNGSPWDKLLDDARKDGNRDLINKYRDKIEAWAEQQSNNRCEKSEEEFNNAVKAFDGACGATGVSGGQHDQGAISCSQNLAACIHCTAGSDDENKYECKKFEKHPKEKTGEVASTDGRRVMPAEKAEKTYRNCPTAAGKELEKYLDKIEKAREKVDELEDKLPTLKNEIQEITTEVQTELNSLEDQMAQLDEDLENSKAELDQQVEQQNSQLAEKAKAVRNEINQLHSAKQSTERQKGKERTQLDLNRTQLRLACNAEALKFVEEERQKRIKKISEGTYTAGDFNNMFSKAVGSQLKKDQALADYRYKICLSGMAYRDSINDSKKSFNDKIADLDAAQKDLQKSIETKEADLTQIQTEEPNKILMNAGKRYDLLVKKNASAKQKLVKQANLKRAQAEAKIQNKRLELGRLEQKIAAEKSYLEKLQRVAEIRESSSEGSDISKEDYSKVWSSFAELKVKAHNVYNTCKGEGSEAERAQQFLLYLQEPVTYHDKPRSTEEIPDENGTPAAAPATASPNSGGSARPQPASSNPTPPTRSGSAPRATN